MEDLLNHYQRTSVQVVLRQFEESLRHAKACLNGPDVEGILFRQRLNISKSTQAQALQQIAIALDQIRELSRLFAFDVEEQDPVKRIMGEMSVNWSNLLDLRSRKLKRYGKVHPELTEILDPYILDMSRIAQNLITLFEEDTQK